MTIDPKTIAADIMCGNARDVSRAEIWAHIGQAYDTTPADASIADKVADLIAKTGIDLIWPDGSKNTELDAARVEIERQATRISDLLAFIAANESLSHANELTEELALARAQVADLADKLHKANAANASLTKAGTAWANEVAAKDKVVEAAKAWVHADVADFGRTGDALTAAVEALPKKAESELADRRHPIAEQGCDNCSVEPGEPHRYWGCPEAGPAEKAEVAR